MGLMKFLSQWRFARKRESRERFFEFQSHIYVKKVGGI